MAQGFTGAHFIDFTKFLLLAGRAGSTNDAIISTTTDGMLTGSSASGAFDLTLRSNSVTPQQATINIADNIAALGANQTMALTVTPSLTFDNIASSFTGLLIGGIGTSWLWTANGGSPAGVSYTPLFKNSPSGTGRTISSSTAFNTNLTV